MKNLLWLIRIEWRSQRVVCRCVFGFLALALVASLGSTNPSPASHFLHDLWMGQSANFRRLHPVYAWHYFVLVFAFGQRCLARDLRDGTIRSLDALPVSRMQIVVAKMIVGGLLLIPFVGGLHIGLWAENFCSRNSISSSYFFSQVCRLMVHDWLVCFAWLWVAVLFSVLRIYSWLLVAFLPAVLMAISGWFGIESVLLNPICHFRLHLDGDQIQILHPSVQGLFWIAATAAVISIWWFCRYGDNSLGWWIRDRWRGKARVLIPLGAVSGIVVCVVVAICLWGVSDESGGDHPWGDGTSQARHSSAGGRKGDVVKLKPREMQARATERVAGIEFRFREGSREKAQAILSRADEIHDSVSGFFGVDRIEGVVVDLESELRDNAAGTAKWKRINLSLNRGYPPDRLAAVLAHELVHVYIDSIGGTVIRDRLKSTRWFHEGLASWFEVRFFGTADDVLAFERHAAVAATRGIDGLADLILSKQDSDLVYPLGFVFCDMALAQHDGSTVRALLEGLARTSKRNKDPLQWWMAGANNAGMDLAALSAAYSNRLRALTIEHGTWASSLPRLAAYRWGRNEKPYRLGVHVQGHQPDGYVFVVEVRPYGSKSHATAHRFIFDSKDRLTIPWAIRDSRLETRCGLSIPDHRLIIWEDWEVLR